MAPPHVEPSPFLADLDREESKPARAHDEKTIHDDADSGWEDPRFDGLPQVTLRSLVIGSLLGTVISASNFYMGLKMGWTFGASIFGAIFGFTILSIMQRVIGGARFGPKEHVFLQSCATAAGSGTTAGYISGIPAMYRLGLLTSVQGDLFKLALWGIAASLYGIFFAIPLRKYFILKQKLVFPTPTGAANIIRAFHSSSDGAGQASRKTKAMLIVLFASLVWLIAAFFVPVLKSWHIFWWIGKATGSTFFLEANKWNFYLTASFAFVGAGMMTSVNNAASTMAGSVIGWGIVAPILLSNGVVFEKRFSFGAEVTTRPSARYWLLWPGILMMICASFTELGCNWRMLWRGVKGGMSGLVGLVRRRPQHGAHGADGQSLLSASDESVHDPAPPHEQVPALWWVSGLIISIVTTVLVLYFAWGIDVGETLLAILLGFILAFIGIQSSGETDINPTGAIAKTSQIVFAALPPHNPTGKELAYKQTASLVSGLVSAASAHQSTDMVGDLKTGHLLRASPRAQFVAQLVGSLISVGTGLAFWVLFASAYPCITNADFDDTCPFALQAVTAWQGVTIALTTKNSIPMSALYSALAIGLFTIVYIIAKNKYVPASWKPWMPNMSAMGVALVNTDQGLIVALFLGAIFGYVWERRSPQSYEMYMFAVAAGLVAGEGIYGVISAAMTIIGWQEGMGSMWGMPH